MRNANEQASELFKSSGEVIPQFKASELRLDLAACVRSCAAELAVEAAESV